MSDLTRIKAEARARAFARRQDAWEAGHSAPWTLLSEVLKPHLGRPLAGYLPMRTEIDPLPAMAEAAAHGLVGVPITPKRGLPLTFRQWSPGCAMMDGGFGTQIPASGDVVVPEVLIVPLVAFDRRGGRLGYGGGFYDRTLAALRADHAVMAIGYAWAAQEDGDLPLEETDAPLDLIVTESDVIRP
ncbi:5-formyltetrahydrofolate cyclo-ligase [Rubellimicrobium rubrum]|uniref:5-formyltetrahydrofolate cyclo-ligase n=1 Tax=Rubellimicrobium rubrum TaxID=2585369 RepID=A0A5C4MZW1_9RHOB|nr:5-formyltetrahydrofolate cyclo-ligase [Rubellimicrobium rubrum]TNC51853.1 5-formyltetrahydrofolate cyclo-ligase [Rubellimicrobium rubrum]